MSKFGGPYSRLISVTSAYTYVPTDGDNRVDVILADASAGAFTITLPDPTTIPPVPFNFLSATGNDATGRVRIIKVDTSSYPVTIAAAAGSILGTSVLREFYQGVDMMAANSAWYGNIGTSRQQVFLSEVSFTSAQVKALRATPGALVRAQGAGTIIRFLGAELILDYGGSNGFTETADNFAIRYTDGSGVIVSGTIENTGFIDQTADTATGAIPVIDGIVAKAGCENVALVLHNTGDGEIAGNAANDNVLRVKTWYSVISSGW